MTEAISSFQPEDILHVKITCRCGQKDIAEVPRQVSRMLNLHVCSQCARIFGMQMQDEGWKIKGLDLGEGGVSISVEMMRRLGESFTRKANEAEAQQQSENGPEPVNHWKN